MSGAHRVVVIMPVGSDPSHAERSAAIKTGLAQVGYAAVLPTYDAADPHFSPEEFTALVRSADAVLADLTGERPSCYFELGFAEALGKPARLFAQAGTDIHQSSHRHAIVLYRGIDELAGLVAASFQPEFDRVKGAP